MNIRIVYFFYKTKAKFLYIVRIFLVVITLSKVANSLAQFAYFVGNIYVKSASYEKISTEGTCTRGFCTKTASDGSARGVD